MQATNFPETATQNRPWLAAAFLMLGAFMNILDATVVNLALPAIRDDLGAGAGALQWVLVVYILTFAAGLLPFGRFGDLFGRRRVFLFGLLGFMATSVAAGAAPDISTLIVVRGVQGIAAAAMVPQVLALIHGMFSANDRGKAIGLFGMINALGAVAGPVIGGAVISADLFGLGWRPIFLINLPLGIIALVGVLACLPTADTKAPRRADWLGAALFAMAIAAFVFPLIEGRTLGWPVWIFAAPAVSALLTVAFQRRQIALEKGGRMQTLPASLIQHHGFVTGVATVMVMISTLAGTMVVLAVFLQSGLGLSPAASGLALVPNPICAMIASLVSGRMGARWLPARIVVGLLLLLVGMVWLRAATGTTTTGVDILVPLALIGGGGGTAFVALFQTTLSQVEEPDAGAGSGTLQAFQQVGIAIGIALVGQLFFGRLGVEPDASTYRAAIAVAMLYPIVALGAIGLVTMQSMIKER